MVKYEFIVTDLKIEFRLKAVMSVSVIVTKFKPYFYFTNTICHEVNLFTLFTHEYQFDLVTSPDPFPGIITAFIISIFIERGPTKIKCNFYFVLYILYW